MQENSKIQFKVKSNTDKTRFSIEIYRLYGKDIPENMVYIDSMHPMDIMELHDLKNFLQEYLHKNDWY